MSRSRKESQVDSFTYFQIIFILTYLTTNFFISFLGNKVVVICTDDTGKWGNKGIFASINSRWPKVAKEFAIKLPAMGTCMWVKVADDECISLFVSSFPSFRFPFPFSSLSLLLLLYSCLMKIRPWQAIRGSGSWPKSQQFLFSL